MTTLNALFACDMTNWDLTEVIGGTVTKSTATEWDITGVSGANFELDGTGLTYGGGGPPSPLPNGGTFNTFTQIESAVTTLTITGALDAKKTGQFIASNNLLGLQKNWFSGNDTFNGSAEDDHLLGFNGRDTFNFDNGGDDIGEGGKGNDTFVLGASLTVDDVLNGGDGTDTLELDGDYFFDFNATTMTNVEKIELAAGHTYQLSFVPGNIGSGGLFVDGTALGPSETMLAYITSGNKALSATGGKGADVFLGAGGRDVFIGGAGGDNLNGGDGGDNLTGGGAADRFVYQVASNSTGVNFDTINDFKVVGADEIILTHVVSGVDTTVTTGSLSTATFDTDLAAAIGSGELGKFHVVVFRPDGGDFDTDTFLIIDMNNKAGYQANKDIVILMTDDSGLGGLSTGDFGLLG